MSTRTTCKTLLVMSLALGSVAWGANMPQSINTSKDLKSALKAARTPEDHERIAAYYQAKADKLDAQATGYEQAAQSVRNGPVVKNIMAPNTAARYESLAKGYRTDAQSYRQLEDSQEQMAKTSLQASK